MNECFNSRVQITQRGQAVELAHFMSVSRVVGNYITSILVIQG